MRLPNARYWKMALRLRIREIDEILICQPSSTRVIQDRIAVMLQQELTNYPRNDLTFKLFQKEYSLHPGSRVEDREQICDWGYSMVDQFNIDREVVLTSWYFIDRILCTYEEHCNPIFVKAISRAALLLASKLSGSRTMYKSMISHLDFNVDLLARMERLLLQSLKWKLHPPTPKAVIRELIGFLTTKLDVSSAKIVSKYAHFFAELSVYDTKLARMNIMSLAVAALLNALEWSSCSKSHYLSIKWSLFNDFGNTLTQEDIDCAQKKMMEIFRKTRECTVSLSDGGSSDQKMVVALSLRTMGNS